MPSAQAQPRASTLCLHPAPSLPPPRYRPGPAWLSCFLAALTQQLPAGRLSPQDWANLLWAIAHLGVQQPPDTLLGPQRPLGTHEHTSSPSALPDSQALSALFPALLACLFEQTFSLLEVFSPQHLANTGWALSKMCCLPPAAWLGTYLDNVSARLAAMSLPELHQLAACMRWLLSEERREQVPLRLQVRVQHLVASVEQRLLVLGMGGRKEVSARAGAGGGGGGA